jgi:hypothetical protein
VTLSGFSGGAFLALKMACQGESRFAYVFVVEGSLTDSTTCTGMSPSLQSIVLIKGAKSIGAVVPALGVPRSDCTGSACDERWAYGSRLPSYGALPDYLRTLFGRSASWSLYIHATVAPVLAGETRTTAVEYWTDQSDVILYGLSGPCTGGGYQQGSCPDAELGMDHRWPGTPIAGTDGGNGNHSNALNATWLILSMTRYGHP